MTENKNISPNKNGLKSCAGVALLMSILACQVSIPAIIVYGVVEYNKFGPLGYAFCLPAIYIPLTLIGVNSYLNAKYEREHPSYYNTQEPGESNVHHNVFPIAIDGNVYQSREEFVNGEYKKRMEREKHK